MVDGGGNGILGILENECGHGPYPSHFLSPMKTPTISLELSGWSV